MLKAIVRLFRTMIGHRPDLEDDPQKAEEYRKGLQLRKERDQQARRNLFRRW